MSAASSSTAAEAAAALPPPAPSQAATPSACLDFVTLANVFAKNKLGFSSQPKAPYSLTKYLSLSFVKGQSFIPSSIRNTIPMPCVSLGPFATRVQGVQLSCTLSTENWPDPTRIVAASSNWNLNDLSSFVYKHHRCPSVLSLPAVDDAAALQACGSYTGISASASQIEMIHARIGHGHGAYFRYDGLFRPVVCKLFSASFNEQHTTFKAFLGEKRIYLDGSFRDSVDLDADSLQASIRDAPVVSLSGVQFVGSASGRAAVLRHSAVFNRNTNKLRVSVKLPIFWTSEKCMADFSFKCAQAQSVTLSTPYFKHSCHVGLGFKFENWAPSVFVVYF
jgi:hypothetical protein